MVRRSATDPGAPLAAATAALVSLHRCAAPGRGITAPALHWAAARLVIEGAARVLLAATRDHPAGCLFAHPVAGASPEQVRALELLAQAPPDRLVGDLERALRAWPQPCFAALGAIYPRLLLPAARKATGAWFTRPELAEPTAQRALAPLLHGARLPRVCDPAVGSGAFLVAALRALHDATGRDAGAIATTCLFGTELDPTAASLAAWTLREACGASAPPIEAIEQHVVPGDGLGTAAEGTFDAVLGNPPWETLQVERRMAVARAPGEDIARWDDLRTRFRHRGPGKLYTYRLFVERAFQLLRDGGRLGLIVPAALYSDHGAASLRELLLTRCRWEWLFGFENRERLFAIDGRCRFGAIIAQKGGTTGAVRTGFRAARAAEWAAERPRHLRYRADDVRRLSPHSGAFVEVRDERDLELLRRLHSAGRPLLGDSGLCRWRQGDFNMTSDAHRFRDRAACEREGYVCGEDGVWRRGARDAELLPLYQGAMIFDLHPNAGAYAGGDGRAVRWRAPVPAESLAPRFLIDAAGWTGTAPARAVHRALTNATNERTAVACLLGAQPCGNSLGTLSPRAPSATPVRDAAFVAGVLGSLVWDWALRQRLAGTNVNGFVLADTVVPAATTREQAAIAGLVLRLCAILPWHRVLWAHAAAEGWSPGPAPHPVGAGDARRRMLAALDVAVAGAFGLDAAHLRWMLRDCHHPFEQLRERSFGRGLDPRGFWRIDRDLPPEARRPRIVLALAGDRPA